MKEDLYIFCDYDSSQLSIAGPHAGIIGLPPLVNEKYFGDDYFGKKNRYLKIKGIVKKGSMFTIKQVIKESNIEDSMIEFVIQFENSFVTKEVFDTGSILNWENYPFNKTFGDQGFDDLDCVELIMDLERELNIVINDDIAEQIVSAEIMPNLFLSEWRNDKIDKIING